MKALKGVFSKHHNPNHDSLEFHLSREEVENVVDALKEWHEACEPKELKDNEVGLNDDRYRDLVKAMMGFLEGDPTLDNYDY